MSSFGITGRHRVAVLVRPGLLTMELGVVHRLFGQARDAGGESLYEVVTCALEPGQLRTDADITVAVAHGIAALTEADTVIVPASDEDYDPDDCRIGAPLASAMASLRPGTRIASICSGSRVLAAAGLLDGRRATTHWRSGGRFRELFPAVEWAEDVLYTDDGDVLTGGGVAAGIDLCLHMIRRDHGSAVANEVARGTVVAPHRPGGQAQFGRPSAAPVSTSSSTGSIRAWALDRLDQPLTLRELAAQGSMSVRTFTRRFRTEVGVSPVQWLGRQRVDLARRLLEETDLPVDRVALASGFGTPASMRQHFQAALGVSPSGYRGTFRGSPDVPRATASAR
ncbi:GlxA family transcriptional regulator [Actinoalloteichus hymeniacidonis]|uniref:AraC family transcriptional regulator n=1 Tax=Actinoalloteichus hymeniacidonis TaxID=340345 RepID=A0AAC9HQS4_9PSEU|nr:helix-turn-helix domain-containing protein [Actinoalloteichus hymeniacidonis]AOS63663.1 AraC family transcriptional regulator [Actinoalloteichus hymeniacidonis]MBB5908288.1 transcriptional regulator GlxA family with amidase domain [Actinoalloteichus hymeniacidonis]